MRSSRASSIFLYTLLHLSTVRTVTVLTTTTATTTATITISYCNAAFKQAAEINESVRFFFCFLFFHAHVAM